MRSSPTHAVALGAILALSLLIGLGSLALAQETSPSPLPAASDAQGSHEREALRQAREAEREARRVAREAMKAQREAERSVRRAWIEAMRERRQELHRERRAAWAACMGSVAASMRESTHDSIADVRAAWQDAWAECLAGEGVVGDAAPSADASGVVRTSLGVVEPGSAPGEDLGLWHYFIEPGAMLPPHTHPGWQLARITSGELEYTVHEGEGTVLRADGSSEPMGPGTYVLATGDGVIENPELVHEAANHGQRPVTLVSATLFEAGEPVATLLDEAPSSALPSASPFPSGSPSASVSPPPA